MSAARSPEPTSCDGISWPERMVRRLAGVMILLSLVLAWKVHPGWLGLTAFVGLNLLQSSFTNFCPPQTLFRKIEANRLKGAQRVTEMA